MKQSYFILIFVFLGCQIYHACDACKLQQPKITQNLTHGTGPQSNWDWVIVSVITLITLLSLLYSAKFLIKPGEKNRNHIKNNIITY
jgi:hypothetical protein